MKKKKFTALIGIVKTARKNITKLGQIIEIYVFKIILVVICRKKCQIISFLEVSVNFLRFFVNKNTHKKFSFKIYIFCGIFLYGNVIKYEY